MKHKKIFSVFTLCLFVCSVLVAAGLRFGLPGAVKQKVKEVDKKVIEEKEALANISISISGYVKDGSGTGINAVTVTVTGSTTAVVTTDSSGYYGLLKLSTGTYLITPSKTGYTFTPASITLTKITSNQSNQNFVGSIAPAPSSWVYTTVDSADYVGIYTSLAVDSNNKVHISYFDNTNANLKYATDATGSWVLSTLDSAGDVGQYPSIALDSNNKVHISYYNLSTSDLKYATNK